jgi:hypothetical protein
VPDITQVPLFDEQGPGPLDRLGDREPRIVRDVCTVEDVNSGSLTDSGFERW